MITLVTAVLAALAAGAGAHFNALERISVEQIREDYSAGAGISLQASPDLISNAEYVTIQYSGISDPNSGDWIGVYSPPDVNLSATAPVKYQFANASSSYESTGSGSLRFSLIDMRTSYGFFFFRGGLNNATAVAKSNVVQFKNAVSLDLP
jgi:hypothetical protein